MSTQKQSLNSQGFGRKSDLTVICKDDSRSPLFKMARYFNQISPNSEGSCILARFNALPATILEGKLQDIPFKERICPSGEGVPEILTHVLLYCPYYKLV